MNKEDLIRFRCTKEERKIIQEAANAERRTLSDYIRITLVDASKKKLEKQNKKN